MTYPDPVLLKNAAPVTNIDQHIIDTLNLMTRTMYYYNGIGLAAPQIKISQRIITADVNGRLYQLINPVIEWRTGNTKAIEGCLSLPNKIYEVERADEIIVQGIDPEQKDVSFAVCGVGVCVSGRFTDPGTGGGFRRRKSNGCEAQGRANDSGRGQKTGRRY